jgi:hypothetical protein
MSQVTIKTIMLLAVLLAVVAVCYSTTWTSSVRADTHWWDNDPDPNATQDPNAPADPNAAASALPEMSFGTGRLLRLSTLPADVNEPNQPPQPLPE